MAATAQVAPVTPIEKRGYAHPEVLVSTDWVAQHLKDPKVRLVESNEDILLYDTGHIPGAVKIDWTSDLNDQITRDYIDRERLQKLLRSKGIGDDTTIVFYGDKNNWWATYALWVLQLFGIKNVKVMDGGRLRWVDEGRPLSTDATGFRPFLFDGSDLGVVVMGTPDTDPIAMGSPDADPILMGAPDTDPLLLKPAPWRRFAAGSGSNDRSDRQTRERRRAEGVPRSR